MIGRVLATPALLALALLTVPALAQGPAPFDMSPEIDEGRPERPVSPEQQPQPSASTEPEAEEQPEVDAVEDRGDDPAPEPEGPSADEARSEGGPAPEDAREDVRHLVPFEELSLDGEVAQQAWVTYLSPEEAAAETLTLGYQNALVVAPEASRLTMTINGQTLIDAPVQSPNDVREVTASVPDGLLVAGRNEIAVSATQRHRTDCTITSTYELWSRIDPATTVLSYEPSTSAVQNVAESLRSMGLDEEGVSEVALVAPSVLTSGTAPQVFRLAQAVALYGQMPNMSYTIVQEMDAVPEDVEAVIVLATASELHMLGLDLQAGAGQSAESFVTHDSGGTDILIVTGPDREALDTAITQIAAPVDRAVGDNSETLLTESWAAPNAPMFYGRNKVSFAELGVPTTRFSGRRYSTTFRIGMASDFYAQAYGEARLLLDAAYSQAVLPGSRINVYVNDSIASTMPITERGGGIFRHQPISVTMRHFKPGVNTIRLEALLMTDADEQCAPGTTAATDPRFAIFESSEFVMPSFGRIAQRPNLGAFAGRGYPYGRDGNPVPLVIPSADLNSYSAAATILSKMALRGGLIIPVTLATAPTALDAQNALFIGAASQMPEGVLQTVGVSGTSRERWTGGERAAPRVMSTEENFEQWRRSLGNNIFLNWMTAFENWLQEGYGISLDALRLTPQEEPAFEPGNDTSLLIAQHSNPTGTGTWTVVAAPTTALLKSASAEITRQQRWNEVDGRLAYMDAQSNAVTALPVTAVELVWSEPPTFGNLRLIVTNWLSSNILSYSVLLTILCVFLGLATAGLLARLGRK